jgi:uncharacterized repeat protein (TIGR01451 family)
VIDCYDCQQSRGTKARTVWPVLSDRLLEDSRLAVDVADDQVWLGARQGLFATLAVSALASNPSRADLDRLLWAPLNRPLHAWPAAGWFASSDAVDEVPVAALPPDLADYDALVSAVLTSTLQQVHQKGLAGLMTFGGYPRVWGSPLYGDELDCSGNDPTPGEEWDNTYWCATWTDYHNTTATAPIWAMRSGEVEWLDDIAFPGALRMLHTQIMQCAPGDAYFYCGQAPAGYGGYRADFNSSHAYFDALFLYYWLTGDYTVVETVRRGASAMRNYLCFRRPAAPCLPDDPPADEWAHLSGRVASQWFAAFRFVGLASDDASYLEDWQSGLARAATQHYVEVEQDGTRYGFWLGGGDRVDGPGTDTTDQVWMASLYDMNNLYRLQRDTHDAPIGNPAIPPSQVLAAWARTLVRFGATVAGDGTASGRWPNALYFTWSGSRIGGTLSSVSPNTGGGDPYLWDTGKACLTAVLVRAGQQTSHAPLTQMGRDLTHVALAGAQYELAPLGKIQGLYQARMHAAVARLAGGTADLAITMTDTPDPVQVGANLAYALTVVNNGSATATGVTVTDALPAGTTLGAATSPQGSCSQSNSSVTCTLGILTSGAKATVTIVVIPTTAGTLTNTATVSAAEPEANTANNTATAVTTVLRTFRLTVSVQGNGTVTSHPAGINCPGDCVEDYGSGVSVPLTTTPASGWRFASWSGNADCTDGSVTMDADKTCTATFVQAALMASLSASPASLGVGETITVGMTVTNTTAQAVPVIPSPLTMRGTGAASRLSGPTPSSATIESGQSTTFTWQYQATRAGSVRFTGTATSPAGNSPVVISNSVTIR